jgi:hypothetical protein
MKRARLLRRRKHRARGLPVVFLWWSNIFLGKKK